MERDNLFYLQYKKITDCIYFKILFFDVLWKKVRSRFRHQGLNELIVQCSELGWGLF